MGSRACAETRSARGAARLCLGQYEGAIADARTVIVGMPDQFFAYWRRGMAHHEIGRTNEAIAG